MARKKKTYIPFVMIGGFFPTEYLEEIKKVVLEESDDKLELIPFMQSFLASGDMKDYEYIKNMILLSSENTITYPDEEYFEGFFIGVPLLNLPEHLSLKRIKLDMRKYFETVGLISEDEEPDAINLIERVVETSV